MFIGSMFLYVYITIYVLVLCTLQVVWAIPPHSSELPVLLIVINVWPGGLSHALNGQGG